MQVEPNSKWTKDGEIVTVTNALKLMVTEGDADVVWYRDSAQNPHIMLRADFLEQYKPFKPVYEYKYVFVHKNSKEIIPSDGYYLDDEDFKCGNDIKCQRLDFTKRERR